MKCRRCPQRECSSIFDKASWLDSKGQECLPIIAPIVPGSLPQHSCHRANTLVELIGSLTCRMLLAACAFWVGQPISSSGGWQLRSQKKQHEATGISLVPIAWTAAALLGCCSLPLQALKARTYRRTRPRLTSLTPWQYRQPAKTPHVWPLTKRRPSHGLARHVAGVMDALLLRERRFWEWSSCCWPGFQQVAWGKTVGKWGEVTKPWHISAI